jgi:hypothetical protein
MSKARFIYRVDEQGRTLRVALARLARAANADTEPLGRYLLGGGRITDWDAVGRALIPTKPRRGKKKDEAAEAAEYILLAEKHWRKANSGKPPKRYRMKLVKQAVHVAWLEDGQWQSDIKKMKGKDRETAEWEYKNEVEDQILNALENKRKDNSRKSRIKTR